MANEKILIVDDEANTRTLLSVDLENAGYQVFQAEDGDAGYQVARAVKPDLIITDILMPQMDGNQLLKKLRESAFARDIPIIVISARGQMQDYFEMLDVDDFISKPFAPDDLLMRVERVLKKFQEKKQAKKTNIIDKKKILILDNEIQDYTKYKKVLMDNKYEVNITETLSQCLETAEIYRPDAVAVTFLIDRVEGDKIVKSLKELPNIKDVPVVVYSHKIRGWEEKKVIDAGAASFVGEVTEEKFLKAIQNVTK